MLEGFIYFLSGAVLIFGRVVFQEKGEKVYKVLTLRGWEYYERLSNVGLGRLVRTPISKSRYHEVLKEEKLKREQSKRDRVSEKDKLRNS